MDGRVNTALPSTTKPAWIHGCDFRGQSGEAGGLFAGDEYTRFAPPGTPVPAGTLVGRENKYGGLISPHYKNRPHDSVPLAALRQINPGLE